MKFSPVFVGLMLVLAMSSCDNPNYIVKIKEGKTSFIIPQDQLLENWNRNLKLSSQIEANLTSIEVLEIEKNYYLRAKGDVYSSTLLLLSGGSGERYFAEGITCTSKTCSTTDGCIPDGKTKCTPCLLNDCTKSVSSFAVTNK